MLRLSDHDKKMMAVEEKKQVVSLSSHPISTSSPICARLTLHPLSLDSAPHTHTPVQPSPPPPNVGRRRLWRRARQRAQAPRKGRLPARPLGRVQRRELCVWRVSACVCFALVFRKSIDAHLSSPSPAQRSLHRLPARVLRRRRRVRGRGAGLLGVPHGAWVDGAAIVGRAGGGSVRRGQGKRGDTIGGAHKGRLCGGHTAE